MNLSNYLEIANIELINKNLKLTLQEDKSTSKVLVEIIIWQKLVLVILWQVGRNSPSIFKNYMIGPCDFKLK